MKWFLIVIGAVAALVVVCVIVGTLRPRHHVARSRVELEAGREAVWAVLADFAGWSEWNAAIEAMERGNDRDGKPVWVSKGKWGDMPSIVEVFEPTARIVTRIPEDADLGFGGSWTYEVAERPGGGSSLTITERGEVGNPVFRFFLIFTGYHTTQQAFLRDLAAHLGEEVQPVAIAGDAS